MPLARLCPDGQSLEVKIQKVKVRISNCLGLPESLPVRWFSIIPCLVFEPRGGNIEESSI